MLQSVTSSSNGQYNLTYFVWTGSSYLEASTLVSNFQLLGYQRMAIQLQYPVTVLAVGSLSNYNTYVHAVLVFCVLLFICNRMLMNMLLIFIFRICIL